MPLAAELHSCVARETLHAAYAAVRAHSAAICAPLAPEDYVVQSMPDASPPKWHLAHTTWFFENFLLAPSGRATGPFDPRYGYLFNSYYETVGARLSAPAPWPSHAPDRARRSSATATTSTPA